MPTMVMRVGVLFGRVPSPICCGCGFNVRFGRGLREGVAQRLRVGILRVDLRAYADRQVGTTEAAPSWQRLQYISFDSKQKRSFQLVMSAECTLSLPALERVGAMFHEKWEMPVWASGVHQVLAFRMLARSGAAIFQLLVARHVAFPYRLFKVLSVEGDEVFEEGGP